MPKPSRLKFIAVLLLVVLAIIAVGASPAASQSPFSPERRTVDQDGSGGPTPTPAPTEKAPIFLGQDDSGVASGAGPNGAARIVLKFKEATGVRLRGSQFVAQPSVNLASVQAILATLPGIVTSRLFTLPEAQLDQMRLAGMANTGKPQADLNLYYALDLPLGTTKAQVQSLLAALNADPLVQIAYEAPTPVPPPSDISPTTPDMVSEQFYLNAFPDGIDADFAWTVPGGTGHSTVWVIDLEYDWQFGHEDLSLQLSDLISGERYTGFGPDHGSAVMGIIGGLNGSYGVTGIAYGVTSKVGAVHFSGSYNVANGITQAAAQAIPGDMILIEQQAGWIGGTPPPCPAGCSCPSDQFRYVSYEYYQAEYDAIVAATAAGVTIIETAGNGFNDLDDAVFGGRFDRSVRDSGAVLVGAGQSKNNGVNVRAAHCYSNFGSRMDVQGIGDSITTAGYGDRFNGDTGSGADPLQLYTSDFGGTSSSGPIVASAAAILQSIRKVYGQPVLTPEVLRRILRTTGNPQNGTRQIGPLPNLRRAIAALRPDTLGIFRPTNATFYLRNTNTTGPADIAVVMGAANDQPVVGDWNGDGVDTVGVYRNGVFYLKDANTTGASVAYQFSLGNPGDLPMHGDWNGDGIDGAGVYRPTNGRLYLRNALSTGFADFSMVFGINGDRPVAGDWDGDGLDSPGIHRPSSSRFYLTNTNCNCIPTANYSFVLGNPNDVPVYGDWNSDALDSVGVFRPTNGIVYLRNALSTGFADISIIYGIANDRPVAGRWTNP